MTGVQSFESILQHLGFDDALPIGGGVDNAVFTWHDVIVRIRLDAVDTLAVDHEAELLGIVAGVSPVPVPEVVLVEPSFGAIAVRRLVGTSMLDRPAGDSRRVAEQVAAMIDALAGVDPAALPAWVPVDDDPPGAYLTEVVALVERIADHLADRLTPAQHTLLDRFLTSSPPPAAPATELRLAHDDLGAEHILVADDGVTVAGVIDWTDAAIADPAHDLGRLCRDLGRDVVERSIARPSAVSADVMQRAVFHARCALIEDLAFGIESDRARYSDAALASFERTFGD